MKNMSSISIRKLAPELKSDYLDFFDNRAFTDGNAKSFVVKDW